MHGGAKGAGGPRGERNGNYKLGLWTREAVAKRRAARAKIRRIGHSSRRRNGTGGSGLVSSCKWFGPDPGGSRPRTWSVPPRPQPEIESDYPSSVARDPGLVMARSTLERLSTE
jgi:hypothetical protein